MRIWPRFLFVYFLDLLIRILFGLGPWNPDLFLLFLIYATYTCPLGEAFFLAFLGGILWDGAFLDFIGMHSCLFVCAAMITSKLRPLLWPQYAISRLILGVFLSAVVRFGETIFWLSYLDYEIPFASPQQYILAGAVVTGLCFMFYPWQSRPIHLSRRSPQTLFAER